MRVCFLLPELTRSGGGGVARAHAEALDSREGFTADIVSSPADASGEHYNIAIATWWKTADALWELDADRHVVLLQSLEQRFYGEEEIVEQLGAEAVLALPLDFIVVASWMRGLLSQLRPGACCFHVPNGIDGEVFRRSRPQRGHGPLRVLIEGQPSLWFKGVEDAVGSVRAMNEPVEVTLLALDPGAGEGLAVDRVVGGLEPPEVADLYAETDVLLKLSRVESLGLPPLEAMHAGLPSIVTPFTGHDEYLEHGVNGVVVPFDDIPGVTRWLDLLARDGELLGRLSRGASETAATWPSPEQAGDAFADALTAIGASPPPASDARLQQRTFALHRKLARDQAGRLRYLEDALGSAREHVVELNLSRDECSDMLEAVRAELEELKETPGYRIESAARRAAARVARG